MSPLRKDEQRFLLGLARRAIAASLAGAPLELDAEGARLPSEELKRPAITFVTLRRQGRLRGCLGSLRPGDPLYRSVAECAILAAFHDPRFTPVAPDEAPGLEIEISVLSPFFRVEPDQIRPGEHGLLISQGFQRGLLLPQVAHEHGWSRERFLEETCCKAGLAPDAWKKGAEVKAFTALVFSEAASGVDTPGPDSREGAA
ncbi:MAG: AmmeMemoRadiSam system protein A [Terriglobia bacterium]